MSKPITINIPHTLGVAEAKSRIDGGFSSLGQAIPGGLSGATKSWDGDRMNFSLQAMGQAFSGWMEVLHDKVVMEINLPGMLGMLAGKIQSSVQKQGRLLLEKH